MSRKRHPGKRVEADAPMFRKLEAELKEEWRPGVKTEPTRRELIGRCAYCGRPLLYERSYHWMYDEDGQRVRKCNDEKTCKMIRKKHGHAESFHKAAVNFNRPGKEHWVDFEVGK